MNSDAPGRAQSQYDSSRGLFLIDLFSSKHTEISRALVVTFVKRRREKD